jgi:HD-like signal output (HDOD) protein
MEMTGILNGFERVPPKFEVLSRLCTLLRSPYVDVSQIVEVVALDPGLSSSVMRLANSSYYGCAAPVDHIEAAVERIGFSEVMKMVGILGRRTFPACPLSCYGLSDHDAWMEALGAAVLMEYLAYHADMEPGTAYLVGLLHSIGRYPIARVLQRVKPGERSSGRLTLMDQARWERTAVDADYATVGSVLLQSWRFGPEVYEPVAMHLQPFLRKGNNRMACLLNICISCLPSIMEGGEARPPEIPEGNLAAVGLSFQTLVSCLDPSRAWLSSTNKIIEESLSCPA